MSEDIPQLQAAVQYIHQCRAVYRESVHVEETERLNREFEKSKESFRVLKSVELNINPKSQKDMPEDSLRHLDLVLGSFHSALRKREDQTERYLAALDNPLMHILGQPADRGDELEQGRHREFYQEPELTSR
jgi:histidinol phosphatase-like PHP family hydrolase